eukprot:9797845-Karenia_brevis.AAC.1
METERTPGLTSASWASEPPPALAHEKMAAGCHRGTSISFSLKTITSQQILRRAWLPIVTFALPLTHSRRGFKSQRASYWNGKSTN